MKDEDKAMVLTTAIVALSVVVIFLGLFATWFLVDREAYRNGYVPYDNGSGKIQLFKKVEK